MTLALLGAIFTGLSLGLLGSGGSILTVPILVYLLGQEDKVAIAGSLAIVGGISLLAAIPYMLHRQVNWRSVLLFGVPGMAGSFVGAWLAHFVSGSFQLLLFALVMLLAAWFMFGSAPKPATRTVPHAWWKVLLEGLTVGVVTGLVGVGGGFLIVPALALLGGLPLVLAIGSSLVIIALKSFVGFFEYLRVLDGVGLQLDWAIIVAFTAIGAVCSLVGRKLGTRVPPLVLRRIFAGFLVVIGVFMLIRKLPEVF